MKTIVDSSKTEGIEITGWKVGDVLVFQSLNQTLYLKGKPDLRYIYISEKINSSKGGLPMVNICKLEFSGQHIFMSFGCS